MKTDNYQIIIETQLQSGRLHIVIYAIARTSNWHNSTSLDTLDNINRMLFTTKIIHKILTTILPRQSSRRNKGKRKQKQSRHTLSM